MNILYVGDIMGEPGIKVVGQLLPALRKENNIDLVIAQGENVTDGKGMSLTDMQRLQSFGVDFFSGGNHSMKREETLATNLTTRPANYPGEKPGKGWRLIKTPKGQVLVVSLLGAIVGKHANEPTDNPLKVIDTILEETKDEPKVATIVNFHGDYSSEKRIIGYYLDGRVSAVIGDHWHVPTADAMILPKGTAHMTDVGMCGTLHSSLGVRLDSVIPRWRDGVINKNELETEGPLQFNAALIIVNDQGLATGIKPINRITS